jgi:hypothetical protein
MGLARVSSLVDRQTRRCQDTIGVFMPEPKPRSPEWCRRDAERNERARRARLRRDAARPRDELLEETLSVSALIRELAAGAIRDGHRRS